MEEKITQEQLDYGKIAKANETIMTIDVKGKEYAEVNQRIKAFRMVYPKGTITTEILSNDNGVCIMKASIFSNNNELLATGTAYEKEGSTFINKTSYIENCETSAVGRALGMCGFGIDTSVASAEEVQNAIKNQEEITPKMISDFMDLVVKTDTDLDEIKDFYKVKDIRELDLKQYNSALAIMKKKEDK